jgi:hypothetical protein
MFFVHSLVRDVRTRTLRAKMPKRARFKMYLAGGKHRLIRKRPLVLTDAAFEELLPELLEKAAVGLLEVRKEGRVLVDLDNPFPERTPPKPEKKPAPAPKKKKKEEPAPEKEVDWETPPEPEEEN